MPDDHLPEMTPSTGRQLRRLGPYELLGELGRGGMGTVYRARHRESGAAHAVKALRAQSGDEAGQRALARFTREAEALARVGAHPAIANVHACGRSSGGGLAWMAMELVEGETLSARLAREGPLPPIEAATLVAALARALQHVHDHGVLHRDVKPDNVLLTIEGRPKLVDFGIAYDPRAESLTATGQLIGTPSFMAPEQVVREAGGEGLGPPVDVYGLGALLFASLTGRGPFGTTNDAAVLVKVINDTPPPPSELVSGLPPQLDAVCERALRKRPADRYGRAEELAVDLERVIAGSGPTPARVADGRRRRRAVGGVVAAVALLAAAGGAIVVVARGRIGGSDPGEEAGGVVAAVALQAAWTEGLARLAAGELAALDDVEALAAGADVGAERREIVRRLRGVAAGDPVTLRTIALAEPPWASLGGELAGVALAAGRPRALETMLERHPPLAATAGARAAIERFCRTVDPRDDEAFAAALACLDRTASTGDRGAEAAVACEARARLLVRWLDARVEDGASWSELPAARRARLVEELILDERLRPTLAGATERRLIECLPREAVEEQLAIAEILSAADLPLSGPERTAVVQTVAQIYLVSNIDGRRDHGLASTLIGLRRRYWVDDWSALAGVDAPTDLALDLIAVERERGPERRAPARLGGLIAVLVEAEMRLRRVDLASAEVPKPVAELGATVDTLDRRWSLIEELLDLDALAPDGRLPGWIFGWMAYRIGDLTVDATAVRWGEGASATFDRRDALLGRIRESIDRRIRWGVPDDPDRAIALRVVERLFAEATRREEHLDPADRTVQIPIARALRLAGLRDPRAFDAILAALDALAPRRALFVGATETFTGGGLFEQVTDRSYWGGLAVAQGMGHGLDAERCAACVPIGELVTRLRAVEPDSPTGAQIEALGLWRHRRSDEARALIGPPFRGPRDHCARAFVHGAMLIDAAGDRAEARELLELADPFIERPETWAARAELWSFFGEEERAAADRARAGY